MLKPGDLYVRKLAVSDKRVPPVAFMIVSIDVDRRCTTIDVSADGSIVIDPRWQGGDDPTTTIWEYLDVSDE
jgi:hypothetical protein